ncbi:MAG: hypothetical protein H0W75_05810 [Chitinophagaceae bacterium]|nr:hypothetical protein [Chitinophagaceae bacterium]
MAERKVAGKDVLLFLDLAGGTAYELIVCLTQNSLKRTASQIDNATKCGPDLGPGAQSATVDFTGVIVYGNDATRLSEADLDDAWGDGRTIGWRMGRLSPVTDDIIYTGQGFISDLTGDYSMTGATFSGTIGVQGLPTKVKFAGS